MTLENKVYVNPGDVVLIELPYSEVCVHMRVAETVMSVRVLEDGAQLLNDDGTPFSFPITHGEAGIYTSNGDRWYTYAADSSPVKAHIAMDGHE